MKRALYNLLLNAGFVVTAPFYFLKMYRRGNWVAGFGQRFGQYDGRLKQALTNRRILWIHAVSVGEVAVCARLVTALESRLPIHKFVVSTTTSTGMGELQRRLPAHVSRIYYPIDRRKHVQRALGAIHPEAMIFVEAEIWPNMIWGLQRRGLPYFLVNARISNRSYRRYRLAGFLFRELFAGFAGVGVQNELDAERLRHLGVRPDALHVAGSLKFAEAPPTVGPRLDVAGLLAMVGVDPAAPVLVGGSTHPGEEAILAGITRRLRDRFPNLFLILVPRHHERGAEVGRELESLGLRFAYRSELRPGIRKAPGTVECLLVNTTGELRFFYERADVVFVGKSLTVGGGQNPVEPAALGKAVVFGPHMGNFPQVVPQFLAQDGAVSVADAAALEQVLGELLADPDRRATLGENARKVVRNNLGALEKTVEMIVRGLDEASRQR
ncbi:MAG: 3-deoxy-D-manno-octulosonic acid transferase [Verrucomicrobiae bacterium]|nr:3-deoxy-D-manno-octulosonic acid transferase [Verrucomicrobiae bacterium]